MTRGLKRGWIELRQSFTNPAELSSHFLWPVLMLIALFFLRDRAFGSTGFMLGALALLVPASRRFGALTLAAYAGLAAVSPHGVLSLSAGLGIEPRGAADVALVAVLLLVAARGREPETA